MYTSWSFWRYPVVATAHATDATYAATHRWPLYTKRRVCVEVQKLTVPLQINPTVLARINKFHVLAWNRYDTVAVTQTDCSQFAYSYVAELTPTMCTQVPLSCIDVSLQRQDG